MKAVNHYIIIQQIKGEPKKVGGLILTEDIDDDNRYLKAKVISIGKKTILFITISMLDMEFSIKKNFTTLLNKWTWL